MKANEIMISDYLSYQGQIIKVASITKKKIGYHIKPNECRMHYARICDCKPIPIIKIHLTKNGFEVRDGTEDMEYFYNDGYEVKVMFDEGGVVYELDSKTIFTEIPPSIFLSIDFAEKSLSMPIEYVHELQYAMRIMGCDKEIEL